MSTVVTNQTRLSSIWLELTSRCQLSCDHCYAESSPSGGHGVMSVSDWIAVIDDAINLGCELVQLIGGEPTLHPDFATITRYALDRGVSVEVATNLVHVPESLWEVFTSSDRLSLAVSYYDARAEVHALVTGTKGSHARTRANLIEAVARGVDVRVNVIEVHDVQDVDATIDDLASIGIRDVGIDDVRGIGRGSDHTTDEGMASLCGQCGNAKAAVLPDGSVTPCVIGRRHVVGSVRDSRLSEVVSGPVMKDTVRAIKEATATTSCLPGVDAVAGPKPKPCGPDGMCQPSSGDCRPTRRCKPSK